MATSGSFNTNSIGGLGSSPNHIHFTWSLSSQNENGNYSTISYRAYADGGSSGYWTYYFNEYVNVHGVTVYNNSAQVQRSQGETIVSGSMNIGHNSSGGGSFGASAHAGIYYAAVNSSGSGSWSLPSLYQEIGYDSISFNTITDVSFKVYCNVNRTANLLQLSINGGGWVTYHSGDFGSVTVQVGSPTSPLDSNKQYSVRLRVRRSSNGNITDSGTYYVTTNRQGSLIGFDF